jgi:hypothetical protein
VNVVVVLPVPGVQREAALAVDDVVPHPQAALLRLPEVIGVQDARDAVLQVDRDQAVVRVAGCREVRRVDDLHLGLGPVVPFEVELLLHPGDVRVRLLDREARRGPHLGVVADEPVDHNHVALREVRLLLRGDLVERRAGHDLAAGGSADDVRAGRAPRGDPRLDVQVAELGEARLRHGFRECPELFGCGVDVDLGHRFLLVRYRG